MLPLYGRRFLYGLLLMCLLGWGLAATPLRAQGLERPSGQYRDLVARYAAGDRAAALAALGGWPER